MTVTMEIQLQDYILEEEIGRGDLAVVYRARRRSDSAEVAVKMLACQFTFDEFFGRRFKEVAKQTARLEHPNIVRTYEAKQQGSVLYVVRELIDARPLGHVLAEEGAFSPQRTLTIARQIASALDYAHQKSITHGDLSVNRVYLDANDQATVADFGQTQAMVGSSLAKQGLRIGCPETLAPERVHGQGPTRQSDLYALGILCYQMLTNKPPFIGTPAAVLHAQAYEQPRPLHLVNPTIPVPLSEAIGRMLAKGLELRYNTGAEFVRALSVAIEGTAPVRAPATAAAQIKEAGLQPALPIWRRPWVLALVGLPVIALLVGLGFGVVSLWNTFQPVAVSPAAPPVSQVTATVVAPGAPAVQASVNVQLVAQVTDTPAIATFTPAPTPTRTPTPTPFPTPAAPTIADGSPFTDLRLAHSINKANQPEELGVYFPPGTEPVYLFFNYKGIKPGSTWTHRWAGPGAELDAYPDAWSSGSGSGTAWIYYNPTGGYQPGPYKVTLELNGQTVATATFVIEPQ